MTSTWKVGGLRGGEVEVGKNRLKLQADADVLWGGGGVSG